MNRFAVFFRQVLHEALGDQFLDHRFVPGEEFPAVRIGKVRFGIGLEHFRRVVFRVDRDRDKFHLGGFDQRLLHFQHARGHERTRPLATREDKVRDPDMAAQIGLGHGLAVLVREGEFRHGADDRQFLHVAPERGLPHRIAHGHGEDEDEESARPAEAPHPAGYDVILRVIVHGIRRRGRRRYSM